MTAVTHPGQIEGNDPVVFGEERRYAVPPMRMRTQAMHKQQHRLVRIELRPAQVMKLDTLDADAT
ncbi:hypothetical protein D3C86_2196940 [compost metagenome]